ncbi:DUF402 domain-containing protein [Bacillus sp. AK031]
MDVVIFWNHVGREHGGLTYTNDIKKSSEEEVEKAIQLKEERALSMKEPNRFIRINSSTILELPPLASSKRFIIIYMLDKRLQFSYGFKSSHNGWLIDIVQYEKRQEDLICVHDLLIDIRVFEDGSYHVIDMDEYYGAYEAGAVSEEQAGHSLKALAYILEKLNRREVPSFEMQELKQQYY